MTLTMKRSNIASKMIGLLILIVAVIFVCADMPALAQNPNSNTTGDATMQNTNSSGTNVSRGRRRARRRARRQARRRARREANTNTSDANANMTGDTTTGTETSTPDANTNTSGGTQSGSLPGMGTFGDVADLSGTYTGTINYPEGGMTGEATLTITSNTFTITAGSATQNGTLSARSWPGYTALSMRFGETFPATIVSTRAWHRGRTLRIQSVRGEPRVFTFNGRSQ
jgi:hypothetical protein